MVSSAEEARAFRTDLRELALYHLDMFQYGATMRFVVPLGETHSVPILYNQFCLTHLISTLFLLNQESGSPVGGFFGKVSELLGIADDLKPIGVLIQTPIGKTTFGDFLRVTRNRLMTHRDLSVESLNDDTKSIPFNDEAVDLFEDTMEQFVEAVVALKRRLSERWGEDLATNVPPN